MKVNFIVAAILCFLPATFIISRQNHEVAMLGTKMTFNIVCVRERMLVVGGG